jgi:hypothetical protein
MPLVSVMLWLPPIVPDIPSVLVMFSVPVIVPVSDVPVPVVLSVLVIVSVPVIVPVEASVAVASGVSVGWAVSGVFVASVEGAVVVVPVDGAQPDISVAESNSAAAPIAQWLGRRITRRFLDWFDSITPYSFDAYRKIGSHTASSLRLQCDVYCAVFRCRMTIYLDRAKGRYKDTYLR